MKCEHPDAIFADGMKLIVWLLGIAWTLIILGAVGYVAYRSLW